jgi:SulP family sulfate permease
MELFKRAELKGDVLGGFSAGIVTLPVALAYGVATGLGPLAGMFSAVILGLLASLFGGTNTQISCPTGAMTVVVAFIVTQEVAMAGSLENALHVLVLIFALTGIIQFVLGLLKIGSNIRYVPYTVVSGFMSGIGIIIIVLQVKDIFGVYDAPYKSVPDILLHLNYFVANAHWPTVAAAVLTMGIIFLLPRLTKRIPSSLAALLIVSAILFFFPMGVKKLGMVELSFPHLETDFSSEFFNSDTVFRILLASFSLALLGSINSLLTSVVADKMTQSLHNSNRELLGQGLGNFAAALFGGFPGSGATACTVANIQSGGRNKLSGIVSSLFLLVVLLFGSPVAAEIPHAVLGGILLHIGIVLIDMKTLRKMSKIPKADNFVMLTVLVLTVFWNLLYAVVIGLIFAAFYFMKKMADVVETDTAKTKVDRIIDQVIESFKDAKGFEQRVLIKNIRGPVFFGFSSRFLLSMRSISSDVKVVVFNMSMVPYVDHSGVRTFIEVIQFLQERKVNICFSEVSAANLKLLRGFDVIPNMVHEDHVFDSVEECILWLYEPGHIENRISDDDKILVPPAFTPNGDGVNDEWKIKNIHKFPKVEIRVYDASKNLVFESIGPERAWTGELNGVLLPPGEYHYEVKLNDEEVADLNGSVFLFR